MKHLTYLILIALTATGLASAAINTDKLEEAIEQSSLSRVKSLLRKTEQEEVTVPERKKMLTYLYELAEETNQARANSVSLVGNWRDIVRTGVGAFFAFSSIVGAVRAAREGDPGMLGGAALLGTIGSYLLYKGVTCSSQRVLVDQAKAVEKFIKGKLRDVEAG